MKIIISVLLVCFLNISGSNATTDPKIVVNTSFNFDFYSQYENDGIVPDLVVIKENLIFPPRLKSKLEIEQHKKMLNAYELLELIVNSEEFKARVISYAGPNNKCTNGSCYSGNYLWKNSSKKLSNHDIYQILLNGDEKMRPNTQNEINLNLRCAKLSRNVIGQTNPAFSEWIEVNWRSFYWRYNEPEMIKNVLHEWIHLLGFLHSGVKSMNPTYVIGKIAEDLAVEYLEGKKKIITKN
jgi:hypothetical protein